LAVRPPFFKIQHRCASRPVRLGFSFFRSEREVKNPPRTNLDVLKWLLIDSLFLFEASFLVRQRFSPAAPQEKPPPLRPFFGRNFSLPREDNGGRAVVFFDGRPGKSACFARLFISPVSPFHPRSFDFFFTFFASAGLRVEVVPFRFLFPLLARWA